MCSTLLSDYVGPDEFKLCFQEKRCFNRQKLFESKRNQMFILHKTNLYLDQSSEAYEIQNYQLQKSLNIFSRKIQFLN